MVCDGDGSPIGFLEAREWLCRSDSFLEEG
jgi:hypothetical protein